MSKILLRKQYNFSTQFEVLYKELTKKKSTENARSSAFGVTLAQRRNRLPETIDVTLNLSLPQSKKYARHSEWSVVCNLLFALNSVPDQGGQPDSPRVKRSLIYIYCRRYIVYNIFEQDIARNEHSTQLMVKV